MRISQRNLPSVFAKLIPYLSCLVSSVAFVLFVKLAGDESDLIAPLTVLVPIVLASVVAIWKAPLLKRNPSTALSGFRLSSRSFFYLVLLFVISYLLSLCFLIQGGPRPMAYFYLVAVMAGLVFIEILGTQQKHSNWQGLILAQIVLLSLNLVLGQTLNLPLYFGGGDLLYHMGSINSIVESGHVTSAMTGGYQYFPLFHIFGTSGVLLTDMELEQSYFVFYGLSFAISLPIVYLLVKQITKDTRLPLLATLLYCLSRVVIFNGMYINTREMAYTLFISTVPANTRESVVKNYFCGLRPPPSSPASDYFVSFLCNPSCHHDCGVYLTSPLSVCKP
jgi:hypothetical protein